MHYVIGMAGLCLIIIGWLVSLNAPPVPLKLSVLYSIGSLLLAIYSLLIPDYIFFTLNIFALTLSTLNAIRAILRKRSVSK